MLVKTLKIFIIILALQVKSSNSIISGDIAHYGQFPWHVYIEVHRNNYEEFYCGGTLISNRWILTSASCLMNATIIVAKFGSIRKNFSPLQVVCTTHIIHPQFNLTTLNRDIGLVKITARLKYVGYVYPVKLATKSMTEKYLIGKMGSICGFGRYLSDLKQGSQMILRYQYVHIAPKKVCLRFYEDIPVNTICAIAIKSNQGACYGDGGGGLILLENESYYVIGIFSYQSLLCVGKPFGYQSVNSNLEWISNITKISIET